ncbi:MAG TPA: ATPase domain-containing protein [Candidatus Bathyarchaeia archaeon]|nr:ATPase domain-containing protein [Candidatus Bathyarchaeia archaeon]
MKALAKTLTGIPGFDEIVGGGFPQGRVVLILGEPGAGKTILCTQFLLNGLTKYGENGLYVSMEEGRGHYAREMSTFGWNFDDVEKEGKFAFVDASPIRSLPNEVKVGKVTLGRPEFSMISLLELVKNNAKKVNAKRIVVDPISLLLAQYADDTQRRKALLDLVEALSEIGATSVMASELRRVGIRGRTLQLEEFVTHGVVIMQTIATGRTMERTIQIEKMRETQIDRQPRPYRITEKGIEVYPRESVI